MLFAAKIHSKNWNVQLLNPLSYICSLKSKITNLLKSYRMMEKGLEVIYQIFNSNLFF